MRIITLSLIMTCVACAEAPQPLKSRAPVETAVSAEASATPTASEPTLETIADEKASADHIQASDIAVVMNQTAPAAAAAAMDMVAMDGQVKAAFAQTNLSADRSAALSESSMALIAAAEAGDKQAVQNLSNKLTRQALNAKGIIGFGLVDIAGIVAAIMDLIAAAANADVAGIMDAIMDLAAAVGA